MLYGALNYIWRYCKLDLPWKRTVWLECGWWLYMFGVYIVDRRPVDMLSLFLPQFLEFHKIRDYPQTRNITLIWDHI